MRVSLYLKKQGKHPKYAEPIEKTGMEEIKSYHARLLFH